VAAQHTLSKEKPGGIEGNKACVDQRPIRGDADLGRRVGKWTGGEEDEGRFTKRALGGKPCRESSRLRRKLKRKASQGPERD